MTTTDWAHLPNAVHIDRVIDSAKANPGQWKKLWVSGRSAAWNTALGMVLDQVREAVRFEAWEATQVAALETARDATWTAPQYAILALIAFDDCAYMLDSDPSELAILAAFGDHRAILLLPACKVVHSLKELV